MNPSRLKEREALLAEAKHYQQEIVVQVEQAAHRVRDDGKKVVLIIGGAVIAFGVLKLLSSIIGGGKKESPIISSPYAPAVQAPVESALVKLIKKNIAEFLLSLAKRTLQELLDKYRTGAERGE